MLLWVMISSRCVGVLWVRLKICVFLWCMLFFSNCLVWMVLFVSRCCRGIVCVVSVCGCGLLMFVLICWCSVICCFSNWCKVCLMVLVVVLIMCRWVSRL